MRSFTVLLFEATATAIFQSVCVWLVSIFIVFCCIPSLHEPVRKLIRPFVVYHVETGLEWVAFAQRFERPWLTQLFKQSSHTVSVPFYGSFLPALIWLGFPELGWHLTLLMTLTLYVGNAMKDLVSAPRPISLRYGHQRLAFLGGGSEEAEKNSKEYGLPSSHTMNSLCFNFYICHYLHENHVISDNMAIGGYTAVVLWVVWIASSRVYLGLHTPIDLLAGAIAGLTVVTTFIGIEPLINAWMDLGPATVGTMALLFSLILLRLHPRPLAHTPTFEFSTSFMGVMFGVAVAVSRCPTFFLPHIQYNDIMARSTFWVVKRLISGFAVVLASKEVSRAVAFAVLPSFYVVFPFSLRRLWQPPIHNQCSPERVKNPRLKTLPHSPRGCPYDVEITSRFFAYAGIGFAACELAPRLFAALNW